MLKTEQRNPKSANIDKASTREMLSIMQDENENAMKAVRSALGSTAKIIIKDHIEHCVAGVEGGSRALEELNDAIDKLI